MIIQNSCRLWGPKNLHTIMCVLIILHNIILEDERHINVYEFENPNDPPISRNRDVPEIDLIMSLYEKIMETGTLRTS
jgi:hypothetical protein